MGLKKFQLLQHFWRIGVNVELDTNILSIARTEPEKMKVRQKACDLEIKGQLSKSQYYS